MIFKEAPAILNDEQPGPFLFLHQSIGPLIH